MLVLHDARQLTAPLRKLFNTDDWDIEFLATRNPSWKSQTVGVDCVVLLIENPDTQGTIELIDGLKGMDDNLPVLVLTRSKSAENAVAAMKAGAFDYLMMPVEMEKIHNVINNAIRLYTLIKRVYLLENQVNTQTALGSIIGQSPQMLEIFNMIRMVGKSNATVLIIGESGTGKELVAQAIHDFSLRKKNIFLDINCGAIPRELLENELFGHERGAYTGADKRYIGSCERAEGGTLFLDEISEMDPLLQVKLLRFLQERSFMRIGGNESISVDVRIVAATNRAIEDEVKNGNFREDLYYRLNVVPIHVPPLRDRKEDIPLLAKHFLDKYTAKNNKIFLDFSADALEYLIRYEWPGNVRELENIIERVVVLNNDSRVKVDHLPEQIKNAPQSEIAESDYVEASMAPLDGGRIIPLELVEKYAIESALKRCLGNVSETARKLQIGQATLYRKIKQFALKDI